ncbi:MerR family transcriptional regulator [Alkalihalobacillus sp. LMS6]|uniref:MerR family transcriptional regulator n=1 Tax=Bacillaceae TaxID=186817 RepID=UPI000C06ED9A|nr:MULTISPECIES: MerR family transcriptional regulator [Bacillaceae]UTR06689.1 MerR family transcriptional regulator [Alkalihalobacillus sp. LMS6]
MLISEVSDKTGLSQDTLRYYERIGLIPRVKRSKSGIREYDDLDCRRIEFAKCMRKAGLPIEVLIEYVALYQQGDETAQPRKEILIEQRAQLKERLQDMTETLDRLDQKILQYESMSEAHMQGAQS